jgi:hypothetical protein
MRSEERESALAVLVAIAIGRRRKGAISVLQTARGCGWRLWCHGEIWVSAQWHRWTEVFHVQGF